MKDKVLEGFLNEQYEKGTDLAGQSDLFDLVPLGGPPAQRYLAHFAVTGMLIANGESEPEAAMRSETGCTVGIWMPDDYLRRCNPFEILTWLGPSDWYHPNIKPGPGPGLICIGPIAPGTSIVELIYRTFEVITYRNVTPVEHNALNRPACAWARRNQHLFPTDPRPLKRRALAIQSRDLKGA